MVSRRQSWLVLLFSVLVVWSHWNLFSTGVIALGFNFSLFWVGFALLIYSLDSTYRLKRDWVWLCPIILIALSYSLYENPWLKLVSLFLFPIVIGVFCAYSHFENRNSLLWNSKFIRAICSRFAKPLHSIGTAFEGMRSQSKFDIDQSRAGVVFRVLLGISILIPLGFVVILLLASADTQFGEIVLDSLHAAFDTVSWLMLWKLFLSILLAVVLVSIALGWSGPVEYSESPTNNTIDGLVAGIVLGGLLVIYIAFLILQLDNLVIDTLPENYREAELMVKSGFWQLFLLAVLNTVLFFIVYRKTGSVAQWVLRVFIVASSLLMVSAAWKVWLYSYTFGLSYEKFFACYTAVFALGVLVYLVTASLSFHRRNVVKVIGFAALWGYSIATISPIEKVIFHANLHFAEQDNTRISVDQLTQLSLDVMGEVDEVFLSQLSEHSQDLDLWRRWRVEQENRYCTRRWYELNLSAVSACR